ncbi:MAG: hypothetical protein FJX63_08700 [Alphaproteobacteria bacterium]|nr:hypothetical protein [Alphaproteobacteria bacterium]
MASTLLFLHFVGLMVGATGSFASGLLMRRALTLPEAEAQTVRKLGPLLANVSAVGLVFLWVTGPLLVMTKWEGGFAALSLLFDVKMIFAVLLTLTVGAIHWVYGEIRKGRRERASLLPKLGPLAGITSLLTVLFAVLAFS